jgi:hypothetical protein
MRFCGLSDNRIDVLLEEYSHEHGEDTQPPFEIETYRDGRTGAAFLYSVAWWTYSLTERKEICSTTKRATVSVTSIENGHGQENLLSMVCRRLHQEGCPAGPETRVCSLVWITRMRRPTFRRSRLLNRTGISIRQCTMSTRSSKETMLDSKFSGAKS